jgi:serine/threonine protein kinase
VPWQAASEKELGYKIINSPLVFPGSTFISEEGKDFLRRCLILDECQRTSIEEMENHPWVRRKISVSLNVSESKK